jgi:hypothetical protein
MERMRAAARCCRRSLVDRHRGLSGGSNSNFGLARGSRLPIDTYLAKVGIP